MLSRLVNLIKFYQHHIFLASCIVLIAVISYNLGQINSLKKTPINIKNSANLKADIFDASSKSQIQKTDTRVVASKNSDKYHYTNCSGAKRIKPENQIWFNSAQEAESKGYVLAGNCSQ